MNIFTPQQPGRSSSSGSSSAFSGVAPTKKAWSVHARPFERSSLSCMASGVTVSGLVFGISKTAVTPPSAAERMPDSKSSLCSLPGSRKCTWLSMMPGRTMRPVASTTSPASPEIVPISTIFPSRTATSVSKGPPVVQTVPFLMIRS